MDIDKLTLSICRIFCEISFGSLMDIDKLTHEKAQSIQRTSFGSLMDIDKLTRLFRGLLHVEVLVL